MEEISHSSKSIKSQTNEEEEDENLNSSENCAGNVDETGNTWKIFIKFFSLLKYCLQCTTASLKVFAVQSMIILGKLNFSIIFKIVANKILSTVISIKIFKTLKYFPIIPSKDNAVKAKCRVSTSETSLLYENENKTADIRKNMSGENNIKNISIGIGRKEAIINFLYRLLNRFFVFPMFVFRKIAIMKHENREDDETVNVSTNVLKRFKDTFIRKLKYVAVLMRLQRVIDIVLSVVKVVKNDKTALEKAEIFAEGITKNKNTKIAVENIPSIEYNESKEMKSETNENIKHVLEKAKNVAQNENETEDKNIIIENMPNIIDGELQENVSEGDENLKNLLEKTDKFVTKENGADNKNIGITDKNMHDIMDYETDKNESKVDENVQEVMEKAKNFTRNEIETSDKNREEITKYMPSIMNNESKETESEANEDSETALGKANEVGSKNVAVSKENMSDITDYKSNESGSKAGKNVKTEKAKGFTQNENETDDSNKEVTVENMPNMMPYNESKEKRLGMDESSKTLLRKASKYIQKKKETEEENIELVKGNNRDIMDNYSNKNESITHENKTLLENIEFKERGDIISEFSFKGNDTNIENNNEAVITESKNERDINETDEKDSVIDKNIQSVHNGKETDETEIQLNQTKTNDMEFTENAMQKVNVNAFRNDETVSKGNETYGYEYNKVVLNGTEYGDVETMGTQVKTKSKLPIKIVSRNNLQEADGPKQKLTITQNKFKVDVQLEKDSDVAFVFRSSRVARRGDSSKEDYVLKFHKPKTQ